MIQAATAFGGGVWACQKLGELSLPTFQRAVNEAESFKLRVRLHSASTPGLAEPGVLTQDRPRIGVVVGRARKETELGDFQGRPRPGDSSSAQLPWRFNETLTFSATVADVLGPGIQVWLKTQFNLGICYNQGAGVEKDPAQAAQWYRRAAEQNHASAQFSLGADYIAGIGVERNLALAVQWLQQAAKQRYAPAFLALYALATDAGEKQKWIDAVQSCVEQRPAGVSDLRHGDVVVCDLDLPLGIDVRPDGQKAQHWALYDDKNKVFLERTGANSFFASGVGTAPCVVQNATVFDFTRRFPRGWKVVVWPEADGVEMSFDRGAAVDRARERLGEPGYHALERNCEHFVMECLVPGTFWSEFGGGTSLQAERFKSGAGWFGPIAHGLGSLSAGTIFPKGQDGS